LFRQENVLSFDISVQNFAVVQVFDSKQNLDEPINDLAFFKVASGRLDLLLKVAIVCILHNDTHFQRFRALKPFNKADQVWVIHMGHDVRFILPVLPLLACQL
jgi:outer membrane PBP1 activator LpoA protein